MNYSEVEAKVREATNDDTWGPHGTLMNEIAKYTFTYESYPEVMAMLWKRMLESKKKLAKNLQSDLVFKSMENYMFLCLFLVTSLTELFNKKWFREGCNKCPRTYL